jgi:hypothetical protein
MGADQGVSMTYENDKTPELHETIGLDDQPWRPEPPEVTLPEPPMVRVDETFAMTIEAGEDPSAIERPFGYDGLG